MRIELLPLIYITREPFSETESEENCTVISLSSQDKLNWIPLEMPVAPGNAQDLGSTLAVPLGSTEEVLRPSLKRFSEEGRALKICENYRRKLGFWMSGCKIYVEEVN